ncbi:MAG TPA: hypothetical protein V6C76_14150 [Drouetiella sp.]
MFSKKFLSASALLLVCGVSTMPSLAKSKTTTTTTHVESAEPKCEKPGPGEPPPPPISDAELERIAGLKTKMMETTESKMGELHSLHRQLELLMTKSTIDRAQALQLQSRINAIHADLANTRLNFELDMMEGMPAEAREKMRKHRLMDAAFGPPGGHGPGAGLGGPPPPGFGPPPTCPPPGFGPMPPFGLPPFGGPMRHGMGPIPGGGPGAAPPPPPEAKHQPLNGPLPKEVMT